MDENNNIFPNTPDDTTNDSVNPSTSTTGGSPFTFGDTSATSNTQSSDTSTTSGSPFSFGDSTGSSQSSDTNSTSGSPFSFGDSTGSSQSSDANIAGSSPFSATGSTVKEDSVGSSDVYETANKAATNSAFSFGETDSTLSNTAYNTTGSSGTTVENGSGYSVPEGSGTYNTTSSFTEPESNGFAIASLVLGIISIVSSCCCCICVLFSIAGIVFGCLQKPDSEGKKPGMATAGIITSIVGLVIYVILTIISIALTGGSMDAFSSYM